MSATTLHSTDIQGLRPALAPTLVGSLSWSRLTRLAIPATLAALCSALFTTSNAYWVGQLLGPDALAAVSVSLFWSWALLSLSEILGIGLMATAAQAHGRRQPAVAAGLTGQAIFLGLAFGLLIALVVPPFLPSLLSSMHVPAASAVFAVPYLTLTLYGAPVLALSVIVDSLFRASGDTTTPFKLTGLALASSFFITPLLITGAGPLQAQGIQGAAISVIIAQGVATIIGLVYGYKKGLIRLTLPSFAGAKAMVRIGLPAAMTGLIISFCYIFLVRFIAPFGTPALAAIGIGDQIEAWLYITSLGLGEVVAATVGQNVGAGDLAAARRTTKKAIFIALGIGFTTCFISYIFAPLLASQFTTDASVVQEAVRYMRLTAAAQLFFCVEIVLDEAMAGAGYTFKPMLVSTFVTVLRLPIAFFAVRFWGLPGLWLTLTFTTLIRSSALFMLWRSFSHSWSPVPVNITILHPAQAPPSQRPQPSPVALQPAA